MSLADNLDAWNNLSGSNSTQGYDMPTADEISGSSAVDSSGFSLSGMQIPSFLKLGSSFLGAYGQLLAGDEAAGADQYNSQLALDVGEQQIDQLEGQESEILSTQNAMYAKAGVTMSGSPLDVALNTATNVEMDKQIVKYNAQSKSDMYNYKADVEKSQAKIKAGQTLLSGAASGLPLLLL